MPGHEDRVLWTQVQALEAVIAFLKTLEPDGFAAVFSDLNIDPSDLTAFRSDDSRRQDGQLAAAREWWDSVRAVAAHNSARFLTLAEPLAQHGIALNELYAAVPKEYHVDALTGAFVYCGRQSRGGLPLGISVTKGWTDEQLRQKLEEVKEDLDWANTAGNARNWWLELEKENAHRCAAILRLAEELAVRKATIMQFFLASVYSKIDNIQGILSFLDYTRLKKEEELKRKDAAGNPKNESTTQKTASSDLFGWPTHPYPLPGMSSTKGMTDEQLGEKLEEVKVRIDWENTTGTALKWWAAFEKENVRRVLWLAEELAIRKATITEFFLAPAYSNTDNIQAILCYLDYMRVKKEEERIKKDAAEKIAKEDLF